MLSINKILFTLIAVGLIWYGFKWIGRVQAKRRADELERAKAERVGDHVRQTQSRADGIEDMVACSKCGAFVPAQGSKSCGKQGCPFPE